MKGNGVYGSVDKAGAASVHAERNAGAAKRVEYGARVLKIDAVGLYTYSDPVTHNQPTRVDPDAKPGTTAETEAALPAGFTKVGESHFHPKVPGYMGDRFSFADIDRAVQQHITTYLGPTQGGVLKYDPNTQPHQSWVEPPQ